MRKTNEYQGETNTPPGCSDAIARQGLGNLEDVTSLNCDRDLLRGHYPLFYNRHGQQIEICIYNKIGRGCFI